MLHTEDKHIEEIRFPLDPNPACDRTEPAGFNITMTERFHLREAR